MKKYSKGVDQGILPIVFNHMIEESVDNNHELRRKRLGESYCLFTDKLNINIEERALLL